MIYLLLSFLIQTWSVEQLTYTYVDHSYSTLIEYNDLVYLAYGEGTFPSSGDLHLSIGTLNNWADTVIFSSGSGYPRQPSLDIDANGKIHIVFVVGLGGLWYATDSSGTWQISSLSFASNGHWPQIAADHRNDVHLVYSSGNEVVYANNSSGDWNIEWSINYSSSPSIALDYLDYVHVAYVSGGIYHITNSSGSWVSELAVPTGGKKLNIKVDLQGKVHIVYNVYHETGPPTIYYSLGYADNTSGSWSYTELDSSMRHTCSPSLMIDKNGFEHIMYSKLCGSEDPEIYYITNKDGLWEKSPITTNSWNDDTYFRGAFDIDASGYGHATFNGFPEGSNQVFYARSDSILSIVETKDKHFSPSSDMLFVPPIIKDKILLKFKEHLNSPIDITLYNIYGSPIFEKSLCFTSNVLTLKDAKIKRLSSGIYFLSVYTGKRRLAQAKVIKF